MGNKTLEFTHFQVHNPEQENKSFESTAKLKMNFKIPEDKYFELLEFFHEFNSDFEFFIVAKNNKDTITSTGVNFFPPAEVDLVGSF